MKAHRDDRQRSLLASTTALALTLWTATVPAPAAPAPLVPAVPGAVSATPSRPAELQLRYLANEGFHLRCGSTGVLIDALFGEGLRGYPAVSNPERQRLETASAPYDQIDLVLVTHQHPDHFDPVAVHKYLLANTDALFASTPQVVDRLLELGLEPQLQDRVHALWPDAGSTSELAADGWRLTALRLHHGIGSDTQNLGFVVALGAQRILHVGDTEVRLNDVAAYAPLFGEITVALLPVWFFTYDHWIEVYETYLAGAPTILAMHLATATAPPSYHGGDGSRTGRIRAIATSFPAVQVMVEQGQTIAAVACSTH